MQTLTLEMAKKMAEAAEKIALEKGIHIAVAIMDCHGNLKYYLRVECLLLPQTASISVQ